MSKKQIRKILQEGKSMKNWRVKQFYNPQGKIRFIPQERKFFIWFNSYLSCFSHDTEQKALDSIKDILKIREKGKKFKKFKNKVINHIYYD